MTAADSLFATPLGDVSGFRFDQQVVDVFPDMLNRSIPGYESIIAQSGLLAQRFATPESNCYDLGCSLGATLLAMRHNIEHSSVTLVGIDNSEPMISRCRELIDLDDKIRADPAGESAGPTPPPVTLQCEDVSKSPISNASVVALNFTLQFIDQSARGALLKNIYDGMLPGGTLILSEKIAFDDPVLHELYIDRYHAFKKANGYSDLEISQKRTALENILVPDTLEQHQQRLRQSGFSRCSVWFQCFNFVSLIALK